MLQSTMDLQSFGGINIPKPQRGRPDFAFNLFLVQGKRDGHWARYIYHVCIYNIVHLPPHQSLRPHTCSSLPAHPVPVWATPSPLASPPWTLARSAYSSAIPPCTPSTLRAPTFLSAEGPVNEDWKCLIAVPGQARSQRLRDMA